MTHLKHLSEVVDWRLCIGCGACAYVCPQEKIQLWDFIGEGIRPSIVEDDCAGCDQCLQACPAVQTDFEPISVPAPKFDHAGLGEKNFIEDWGQVVEVWEGHATDPDIRFKGSSGGILTALGAYCLEIANMHGVLHIAQDPDDPVRNRTRLSRSREELIAATGSRYSPASVCNGLALVENAPASCAIIGKPGEIAALTKARTLRSSLDAKVGVTMSFFCAETPSSAGTLALLKNLGVAPNSVADLRYRGFGWPGFFAPVKKGETDPAGKIPYRDSWRFLQSYRPWAVHLWPDGTGELADISCGDPWYEKPDGENPGFSLLAIRTERGRQIVKGAIAAGYITVTRAEPWKLVKSQQYLADKKAATWGRLLAMRLFLLPVPKFTNAQLLQCWMRLRMKDKVMSVVGTARRILTRKLYHPLKLDHSTAVRVKPALVGRPANRTDVARSSSSA